MDNTLSNILAGKYLESPHSENLGLFEKIHPEIFRKIREKLKGKILVDIGGGGSDFVLELARESNAKAYLNLDLKDYHKESDGFAYYAVTDAGSFLEGLEASNAYIFFVSGIDEMSFDGDPKKLAFQLDRLLKSGQVVFGINSNFIFENLNQSKYEVLVSDGRYSAFEKR